MNGCMVTCDVAFLINQYDYDSYFSWFSIPLDSCSCGLLNLMRLYIDIFLLCFSTRISRGSLCYSSFI